MYSFKDGVYLTKKNLSVNYGFCRSVGFAGIALEQMKMGSALLAGRHTQKTQLISNLCRLKRCTVSRLRNVRKINRRNRKLLRTGNT